MYETRSIRARGSEKMRIAGFLSPYYVLTVVALAACVPQTEVIKLYDDPVRSGEQYERLLVVGISADIGARRRLEELITKYLESINISAVAGYTETGLKTELLQEEIDAAARNANADAILITHIVSVDTRVDAEPERNIELECRGGDAKDYSLYEQRVLGEPESVSYAHTVVAVTNLYDAGTGARRWSIQSTCFEKASFDEVLQEEAKAIVKQLQNDRLVG